MTEERLEWLWITAAIELVAQYIPSAGAPETPAATATEFLLIEVAAGCIQYRYRGKPIYRGQAFPLTYFWQRVDGLIEHKITVGNSVIRRGAPFVQATPPPPFKKMGEPDEDKPGTAQSPRKLKPDELCWILGSSQQAADVELPLVQLNRDDILRRMQENGYLPLQHELPLSSPVSQSSAEGASKKIEEAADVDRLDAFLDDIYHQDEWRLLPYKTIHRDIEKRAKELTEETGKSVLGMSYTAVRVGLKEKRKTRKTRKTRK